MLRCRAFTNILLAILSICALPPAPPDLFTYGEQLGQDGRRAYAIGNRWRWNWEPVRLNVVARYVGESSDRAYQSEAQGWLWLPKIEGDATIYYGDRVWTRKVELR